MPLSLRLRVIVASLLPGRHGHRHKAIVKEMGRRRHFTVPRDQIEWHPSIDASKCRHCKVCYDFCPKGVYSLSADGSQVRIANPYACVVLCAGCRPRCPGGAISFPRRADFRHYVYYA